MIDSIRFSIIVPVYNAELYLEECIFSVLCQSYKNFELILIDDGSEDQSGDICDQYIKRFPERVIVSHEANHGPFWARLRGIALAKGEVLIFLDSDDCLRKDALEQLDAYFDKFDCDMVLFDAAECLDFPSRVITNHLKNDVLFENTSKEIIYYTFLTSRSLNSVALKAIRRECASVPVENLSVLDLKHGEDMLLSAWFITNAERIVYLKQGLYHYRIRLGSITNSYDRGLRDSLKVVHTEIGHLIHTWNLPRLNSVHNARKVSGWMDALVFLLRDSEALSRIELDNELKSMAEDPYFLLAYADMDRKYLKLSYCVFSFCLQKGWYRIIYQLYFIKSNIIRLRSKLLKK